MVGQPVFVVGAARSGTTWVQCLICAVEGFYSCPETHFFDELLSRGPVCGGYQLHRPRYLSLPDRIQPDHLVEVLQKCERGFLEIDVKTARSLAADADAGVLTPRILLTRIVEACSPAASRSGSRRWVEKTPIHASYLDRIFALFDDAQIICVLRRPEGVLSSAVRTFSEPVCIAARDYWLSYRDVQRFLNRHPDRRRDVLVVSYDDIRDGDAPLVALQKFLGCDAADPTVLRQEARRLFDELYGKTPIRHIQRGMSIAAQAADTGRQLSRAELNVLDVFAAVLRSRLPITRRPGARNIAVKSFIKTVPALTLDLFRGVAHILIWRARYLWELLLIVFSGGSRAVKRV